ncbi:MAG TPA: hypothetical protein VHG91_07380 [Longimicrobium sp.]|nr:hypothetical protein [Longimicrobium sp.]
MKRLGLSLDTLDVQSFHTAGAAPGIAGRRPEAVVEDIPTIYERTQCSCTCPPWW